MNKACTGLEKAKYRVFKEEDSWLSFALLFNNGWWLVLISSFSQVGVVTFVVGSILYESLIPISLKIGNPNFTEYQLYVLNKNPKL